ncbi:MAG TPA: GWxTD domain-containing protein [Vicinamibacteria bacterium]|nr:GWxTD domain-containing protein [Vicinamibacteria bacterium]
MMGTKRAACFLAFVLIAARGADDRLDRLSEAHRSWLERDVVYIITERERDVFLSLETEEERDRFIEAFWRKRDPNPATPANEYKDEHYRRIDHANTYLGRETFREGWRTDRGRYYILLGEPRETQRYDGYAEIVSIELWFYQGDPMLGVPSFFYLMFFKRNDIGEYRLYHPIVDGPQALMTGSQHTPGSENAPAVEALRQISPELAAASLSFDTSEPPDFTTGRPSLGTEMMLARIEDSPKRAIRTDYADAWLRYGNRVSAEYSFNFVPSRSSFAVLYEPGGTPVVQYSVEIDPQNFTLETDENQSKYYTTLDVTIEARTKEGTLVVANDKEAYVELTPSQVDQIKAFPFAYQDGFPLVPGDYIVTVVLRNRVIHQYTVAERELSIRDPQASPAFVGDVVLAFDTQLVDAKDIADDEIRTFQVGPTRFQPASDNLFVIGDTVHVIVQAFGAGPGQKLRIELANGEEVAKSLDASVGAGGMVLDHIRLDEMVGGNYELTARLLSAEGGVVSEKSVPVTVSPRSAASRPAFVYRRGFNTQVPGLLDFIRGEQLWNLGRFDEAKAALEKAVASDNPRLPDARWKLAHAYLREEKSDEALGLLLPLEEPFSGQYDVVSGLGFAFYLKGDFAKAASYLDRARQIRPPDTMLLNTLGDSHQRLGNLDRAREAFERSLELDPEQAAVKERLSSLGQPGAF